MIISERLGFMRKGGLIIGALGAAAAVFAGGIGYFYELSVPRDSKVTKKKDPNVWSDDPDKQAKYEEAKEWLDGVEKEDCEIRSFDGLKLHAVLIPAEKETQVTVILVHGYRASGFKDFGFMLPFYHKLGVNILMVDDRGHGKSQGDYVGFGWHDHFDVERWIKYITVRFGDNSEIFLHGVSMGAATVMLTSGDDLPEQVKGIIEDCGYSTLDGQLKYNLDTQFHIPTKPVINAVSAVTKQKNGYSFEQCNSIEALKNANVPFLFIHGDKDGFVPTSMVYENFNACASEDKTLILVEGADHAESYYVNPSLYEEAVTKFIKDHSDI